MLMKKELIENNKILLWENRKQKEIIDKVYKYLERKKDIPFTSPKPFTYFTLFFP